MVSNDFNAMRVADGNIDVHVSDLVQLSCAAFPANASDRMLEQ